MRSMRELMGLDVKTASALRESGTPQELDNNYFSLIYGDSGTLIRFGLGESVYLGGWGDSTLWELPNGYRTVVKNGSLS